VRRVDAASQLLKQRLTDVMPLHGGDLSQVVAARLADGQSIVIKSGPAPQVEAAMLKALKHAAAPCPRVIACNAQTLVLERCDADDRLGGCWADLGHVLRQLHAAEGPRYGWHDDYAFGEVPIINTWSDNWPAFWRDNRLLCHVDAIPSPLARRLDTLCAHLDRFLPSDVRASHLHGDLWGGNILCSHSKISALIDPACYYGDAQVDLAMLCLFDQPAQAFWTSYGAMRDDMFMRRQAVYQLWPALVHLRLFGNSYAGMVDRLLDSLGF